MKSKHQKPKVKNRLFHPTFPGFFNRLLERGDLGTALVVAPAFASLFQLRASYWAPKQYHNQQNCSFNQQDMGLAQN